MKFSIKDFFSKCDQIRSLLQICSHLLKKSLIVNFVFCAVIVSERVICVTNVSKSKPKEFITLLSVISQKKRKQQKPRETCLQRIRKKFYYQQLKFMLLTKGTITVPMRSVMEAIARPSRKRLPLFYINSSPMHQIKIIH